VAPFLRAVLGAPSIGVLTSACVYSRALVSSTQAMALLTVESPQTQIFSTFILLNEFCVNNQLEISS